MNIQKAIEHGPVEIVDFPSYKMLMFHCYVSSPEGRNYTHFTFSPESTDSTKRSRGPVRPVPGSEREKEYLGTGDENNDQRHWHNEEPNKKCRNLNKMGRYQNKRETENQENSSESH